MKQNKTSNSFSLGKEAREIIKKKLKSGKYRNKSHYIEQLILNDK